MVPNRAYVSALVHETVAVTKSNRILFILVALYTLLGSAYVWATAGFSLDPYRVYGGLWLKNYLWLLRENNVTGLGSGISAFPSVHVALTMMNALFVYEFNRKLGWAFFAYTAFIVFSSVYLAWHYAIDGYVAIPVTLVLYYVVRNLPIARPVPQDREPVVAHPVS